MRRRALLIAFHFPPAVGSSGVHRSFSLARYLPEYGWEPIVLTVRSMAHPSVGTDDQTELCTDAKIFRAIGLDAARHLSIRGMYPDFLAWPDRWVSWWPFAVARGIHLIRKYKPDVIWSTYPISTSHLIGRTLSRLSGVPWVADFRDSMTDESYPPPGMRRRLFARIERDVVRRADKVVFTAPGTLQMYAHRYPDVPKARWVLNLNGYDEDAFTRAEKLPVERPTNKVVLLHSGVIYPEERDPSALFEAVASLKKQGHVSVSNFEFRLRSTGHDDLFRPMLANLGISDIVHLLPRIDYEQALSEMMHMDGLLLLQATSCNHQIPAKLFEYIRAGRPIFALTDREGDTASLLRSFVDAKVAPLDSPAEIADVLLEVISRASEEKKVTNSNEFSQYSRVAQAERTAQLFDLVRKNRSAQDR